MLKAEQITKSFGTKEALRGVDVTLAPGQITAVIGPTGSGKTTLLKTLSLLEPPDLGMITLDEQTYCFPVRNGTQLPPPPWPRLTVVFQQLFLWPHLTLMENITLPLHTDGRGCFPQEVDQLIASFRLGDFVDRFPNQVSLGQRQLAAFVRAVALKPRYLLLDEITSALDVEHVGRILDQLKALRKQGTSVLLITHLIGFARSAADQVLFIDDGRVEEAGGPSILHKPTNQRLAQFLSLVETSV